MRSSSDPVAINVADICIRFVIWLRVDLPETDQILQKLLDGTDGDSVGTARAATPLS